MEMEMKLRVKFRQRQKQLDSRKPGEPTWIEIK